MFNRSGKGYLLEVIQRKILSVWSAISVGLGAMFSLLCLFEIGLMGRALLLWASSCAQLVGPFGSVFAHGLIHYGLYFFKKKKRVSLLSICLGPSQEDR